MHTIVGGIVNLTDVIFYFALLAFAVGSVAKQAVGIVSLLDDVLCEFHAYINMASRFRGRTFNGRPTNGDHPLLS